MCVDQAQETASRLLVMPLMCTWRCGAWQAPWLQNADGLELIKPLLSKQLSASRSTRRISGRLTRSAAAAAHLAGPAPLQCIAGYHSFSLSPPEPSQAPAIGATI